ncbi:MAG: 3-phosphoshikimate 1-carboxyvinyltransferase [Hyphomonadaceae bacterium]|nr:3-phosphoshikimate 1-carboxyvinyltransferase [Clostridia bacterium]
MQAVTITPNDLTGTVQVPASKSLCHRAVICAALAEGTSHLTHVSMSEDIEATCRVMRGLGVQIEGRSEQLTVRGTALNVQQKPLDCGESGSTLRFAIPLALLTDQPVMFVGRGKLTTRPLQTYYELFEQQHIQYQNTKGALPLIVKGKLKGDTFTMRGDVSSQFVSGLMFALPLLQEDSVISLIPPVQSIGYIDLTMDAMQTFGVKVEKIDEKTYHIKGGQLYQPTSYEVEGDFSQAAFWLVAGVLGQQITVTGLNLNSKQGDRAIVKILTSMGANLVEQDGQIIAMPSKLHGTVIDAAQCPDLVPVLAAAAAVSEGQTIIKNAERLRIKECDRLAAMCTELNKLGACVTETADGLVIEGKPSLTGGLTDSWNDHRIAMALAAVSMKATAPITINGSESVNKSYPNFWTHFTLLHGNCKIVEGLVKA